ncbi:hypothetical protein ACFTQL_13600 [Peribacillus butanolivorans]
MNENKKKNLNPNDIVLPKGYEIDEFWPELHTHINLLIRLNKKEQKQG